MATRCFSACLLARVLEDEESGKPVFPDGKTVLAELTAEEIGALAARWNAFRRGNDPGLARLSGEGAGGALSGVRTGENRPEDNCKPSL